MKHWNDLTPIEQGDYVKGLIRIHGFDWKCYWKLLDRDSGSIEIYSEYDDWHQAYAHYNNLSNVCFWG